MSRFFKYVRSYISFIHCKLFFKHWFCLVFNVKSSSLSLMVMLLINNMPWRCLSDKSHLVPPGLTVMVEFQNILLLLINLLEVLMDNILPAAVWSAARLSLLCRWQIILVENTVRVVIRLSQGVTKPVNTALSDGAEGTQLASPPVEFLIAPPMVLRWWDMKTWMQGVRILLRGYVSAPNNSTKKTVAL